MRALFPSLTRILALVAMLVSSATPVLAQRGISMIRDAETEAMLRSLTQPLFAAAGVDRGLVKLSIISDRSINAFVSTGNRMYVHTGLITQSASVAELAGVLAHETGHVSGGHIARLPEELRAAMIRSIAAMLIGAAAAVGTGQGNAAAIGAAGSGLAMRELFSFTRTQENAADQAAVNYMNRVGWPISGMVQLMQRLAAQDLLYSTSQDPYVRTHPLTRDRILFLEEQSLRTAKPAQPMPAEIERAFQMVRAKLFGFLEGGAAVAREWPAADTSEPARYARAINLFRQGRTDASVAELDMLIAARPASPWLHEMKGQVLFEGGRVREAVEPNRTAARLAPNEPLIRASYAAVLIELNDVTETRNAVTELDAALRLDRDNPGAWRTLGIAWGRLGDMGRSSLALAEEAALMGDLRAQREMAARAEKLLPAGPSKLRAQDLLNAARIEREERRNR